MSLFSRFKQDAQPKDVLPLYFHNSASGKKEIFTSLKPNIATMYSCGPTVYDHAHIGNLRAYLLADLIKRTLTYNGYQVKHVINFTDFGHLTDDGDEGEDKMMKALKREKMPVTLTAMREVAEKYIVSFKEDLGLLRIIPPTLFTPASEYVAHEIRLIKTLYQKGYAYETEDGVYFDISRFPAYGTIGNIDLAKMRSGARLDVNVSKRHPADFALWKKGILGWESEWGKGFPGWHIECTAMVFATLGKQIDVHTGGEDLQYTHHNGEIAQAEAVTGKKYVRYWLHNAHVSIEGTKIAKSQGNGIRLRNLIDRGFSPETYRYWLLTGHYRSPLNFTFEAMQSAKQALFRLKRHIYEDYKNVGGVLNVHYESKFHEAINDDLNTAKALAVLWDLIKDPEVKPSEKVATIRHMDTVLGLGLSEPSRDASRELGILSRADIPEDVNILLKEREKVRADKDWAASDAIRNAINLKGYIVEDTSEGQKITKA